MLVRLCVEVDLPLRKSLYEPGETPLYAYFMTSGIASVVAMMERRGDGRGGADWAGRGGGELSPAGAGEGVDQLLYPAGGDGAADTVLRI